MTMVFACVGQSCIVKLCMFSRLFSYTPHITLALPPTPQIRVVEVRRPPKDNPPHHPTTLTTDSKVCPCCDSRKAKSQFYTNGFFDDGLSKVCTDCLFGVLPVLHNLDERVDELMVREVLDAVFFWGKCFQLVAAIAVVALPHSPFSSHSPAPGARLSKMQSTFCCTGALPLGLLICAGRVTLPPRG